VLIISFFYPLPDICASLVVVSIPGFLGFFLASCAHLILTRCFLRRPTAIAYGICVMMAGLSWRSKVLDFSVARGDYEVLKGNSEAKMKIGAKQTAVV